MAKFTMISRYGEGAHVLHLIEQEGNDVELYIMEPGYRSVWDGLIPKAKKIAPKEGSTVILDESGMGDLAEKLKRAGYAVIGGSKFADKLEHDRAFGKAAMEECGIKVPFSVEMSKFSDIPDFLETYGDHGKRFVFKPSGDSLPSHLTYCSLDDADLIKYVSYVEKYYAKDVKSFVIQEFINGIVVSTEMYCDGERLIRPANHTLEVKAFMDRELGQATGCSGNIIWAEPGDCRIVDQGLGLVEDLIVKSGHVGPIDLNAVVNEEGIFGLEWTPRFGYDATPTLMRLFKPGEIGKFYSDCARAQVDHGMPILVDKYAVGVRLTIPPYPLEPNKVEDVQKVCPNIGIPIRGIKESDVDNFYFYEVQQNEDGDLEHSAGTGVIACVTSVKEHCRHAFEEVYELLNCVLIPDKQYRTDLGHALCEMLECCDEQDCMAVKVE